MKNYQERTAFQYLILTEDMVAKFRVKMNHS